MLRAFRNLAASTLLCLTALPYAAAQDAKPIAWELALLKGELVSQKSQDIDKPIPMKSGDKFQIYFRLAGPRSYVYFLIYGADGTIQPILWGIYDEDSAFLLPSTYEPFTVTPPDGTDYLYVLVSSARQTALEKLLKAKTADANAILEEIKRIQLSGSKLTEVPQKPVPMGGVSRGGLEFLKATQFEGRSSYVQIIRLDH